MSYVKCHKCLCQIFFIQFRKKGLDLKVDGVCFECGYKTKVLYIFNNNFDEVKEF